MNIIPAYDALDDIRQLFREYADSLGHNLCFQSFEHELAGLPEPYAPPNGRLYIASCDSAIAGCIALHPFSADVAEIKRLYVRTQFRGGGIGKALVKSVIEDATHIGFKQIVLETLYSMRDAMRLYKKLGFENIEPYCDIPIEEAIYMGMNLLAFDKYN